MKTDKKLTTGDLVDMDIYDFFDLLAKSNINDVLVIKGILNKSKLEMIELANTYKSKMFDFTDKTFDSAKFDEAFTRTIHCFALAMYLDKKIEACIRREYDLTPKCFKKD